MVAHRVVLTLAVLGAVGLGAGGAQALTMADLTATGASPIVQGDKVYSNFTYASAALPASAVTVSLTPAGPFGLRFSASWSTTANPIVDSVITYDVAVTNPSQALGGTTLSFSATANGGAVASAAEQVKDLNSSALYNLAVITDGSGPIVDSTSDSANFNPTTRNIHVIKDISVSVDQSNPGCFASIAFVDNIYTQVGGTPPVIPEPMSLALLPLALVGLGLRRRMAG